MSVFLKDEPDGAALGLASVFRFKARDLFIELVEVNLCALHATAGILDLFTQSAGQQRLANRLKPSNGCSVIRHRLEPLIQPFKTSEWIALLR